jgi:hypothetical protein
MNPRMQGLIHKLKERVRDPERAVDYPLSRTRIAPPVGMRTLAAAERQLGFELPELLRAIYSQVANGGFGPAYGFLGLRGGPTPEGKTLVPQHQALRRLARANRHWRWPERLLPVCSLGCGMWSCLDCARTRVPVFVFDPNILDDEETDKTEAVLRWSNAFWHEAASFASWLGDWIEDRPRPDPQCPSKTWLRQRLWADAPSNANVVLNA